MWGLLSLLFNYCNWWRMSIITIFNLMIFTFVKVLEVGLTKTQWGYYYGAKMRLRVHLLKEQCIMCMCSSYFKFSFSWLCKPEPIKAMGWSDPTCMSQSEMNRRKSIAYSSLSQARGVVHLCSIKLCLWITEKYWFHLSIWLSTMAVTWILCR